MPSTSSPTKTHSRQRPSSRPAVRNQPSSDRFSTSSSQATTIVIRNAGPRDASNVVRLLMEWHDSIGIEYPQPIEGDVLKWVVAIMTNGYVIVAERAGRLIGTIGVQPTPLPFNMKEVVLRDQFFYVTKAHRDGGVANALMKKVQAWAAIGRIPLIMNIISGLNTEKLDRYYQIQGGIYAGGTLVFGLPAKE